MENQSLSSCLRRSFVVFLLAWYITFFLLIRYWSRFGHQKRHQDWFQRSYLASPESQSLRCDLIRYICCVTQQNIQVRFTLRIMMRERRVEHWATGSSVRSHRSLIHWLRPVRFAFALHCAHSLVHSLTRGKEVFLHDMNAAISHHFNPQSLQLSTHSTWASSNVNEFPASFFSFLHNFPPWSLHWGPEKPRMQIRVLGHLLVRWLVRLHRSLCSLPRFLESE